MIQIKLISQLKPMLMLGSYNLQYIKNKHRYFHQAKSPETDSDPFPFPICNAETFVNDIFMHIPYYGTICLLHLCFPFLF